MLGAYLDRVKGKKPTLLVVSEAHVTSYNPRTSACNGVVQKVPHSHGTLPPVLPQVIVECVSPLKESE